MWNESTHLGGRAAQLLQTVLQTHDAGLQLLVLLGQQVLVKHDLLQEGLGCRVVVAALVGQELVGHLVHGLVHEGHEVRDGLPHVRLRECKRGRWEKRA